MKDKIKEAKDQGFSDTEILDYLNKNFQNMDGPITEAREKLYDDQSILNYLSHSDVKAVRKTADVVDKVELSPKFLYKQNQKIFENINKDHKKTLVNKNRLKKLSELTNNPNLPEGWAAKAFIGKAGRVGPYAAALAPKELIEYQKLIVEMTSGAKDSYGARITNFELETFLNQLPNLASTKAGQKAVIRNLSIINELNEVYATGMKNVFKKAGGIHKIGYDEAVNKFDEKYGKKVSDLIQGYKEPTEIIGDRIKVQSPTGQIGTIPKANLQKALEKGYTETDNKLEKETN